VVEMSGNKPVGQTHATRNRDSDYSIGNGDVLIAAITSCTNTSNPSVMLAAGLLAKKAVEAGLKVSPHQDLAGAGLAHRHRIPDRNRPAALPGETGLHRGRLRLHHLHRQRGRPGAGDQRGHPDHDLVCAAVLSGNRNFEARIHPNLKANFLMSPPLVVAYAIAGSVRVDLMTSPWARARAARTCTWATSGPPATRCKSC
jgi:aconitate hydratase